MLEIVCCLFEIANGETSTVEETVRFSNVKESFVSQFDQSCFVENIFDVESIFDKWFFGEVETLRSEVIFTNILRAPLLPIFFQQKVQTQTVSTEKLLVLLL